MSRPKKGLAIHGWIALDKPQGVTSTQALGHVKRLLNAHKAGHAGTLDPLATGVLPIALGEATKTVSFAVDDKKSYLFTVRWGAETSTDDSEGDVVHQCSDRPTENSILTLLPQFIGKITQVPPQYSAVKVDGKRAYHLARTGEDVELLARTVVINGIRLISCVDGGTSIFEVECGKGTYVRAIARDMGRALGCYGHVITLRRTRVGPFIEEDTWTLEELTKHIEINKLHAPDGPLLPVTLPLKAIPELLVTPSDAGRLARGISVLVRGAGSPAPSGGLMYATCQGRLVALGEMNKGALHPIRVFNLT